MHEEDIWSSWLREDEKEKQKLREKKKAFEIFCQEGDLESCGDTFWEDLLEEPENLSGCELVSGELVRVVLDVTDVLVSPSSVVTEFCDVSLLLWLEFCGTAVLSPKSVHIVVQRVEVRRLTSESASTFKKKDDAAYTCAKFVHLLCEGPGKVRRGRKRMECERKNSHREDETVFGKNLQCEVEG